MPIINNFDIYVLIKSEYLTSSYRILFKKKNATSYFNIFVFLSESVKALLGKHVKILLKNVVKLETKPEKTENRVLV